MSAGGTVRSTVYIAREMDGCIKRRGIVHANLLPVARF